MNRWLHCFAVFTACSTLFLLFAGGMVTSTGSGLAVPDWPLSYGMFFPPMVGGVFYEHGHRMVATFVGFLTVILCAWLWLKEERKWMKWLGTAALLAVISQGVLGGITVLFLLPTPISVGHAALAEIFFCLTVGIALFTSKEWRNPPLKISHPENRRFKNLALITVLAIYVQILLGALMRHTGSGLAIPDFPLAFGHLIPPQFDTQVAIHFAHRVGALIASGFVLGLGIQAIRLFKGEKKIVGPALFLFGLLLFQILLGGLTIWTKKAPTVATLHLTTGAMMLATSVIVMLRACRHLEINVGTEPQKGKIASYFELTKPRVNALVLFTMGAGFFLALDGGVPWGLFVHTLIGTAFVAGGSCAINQCWEKELDATMPRTQNRPLPQGRLGLLEAWIFAISLSVAGLGYLYFYVNGLTFSLGLISLLVYVFIYTPFKLKNSISTLVGAVSGAIPPMMGWAAVRNELTAEAWILFAILFCWQIPAFLSIAWLYREDYSKAGYPMLPVNDKKGGVTASHILLFTGALFWASMFPAFLGMTQWLYFIGAFLLGSLLFIFGYYFSKSALNREQSARRIFVTSMVYLPLLLTLMVVDKV